MLFMAIPNPKLYLPILQWFVPSDQSNISGGYKKFIEQMFIFSKQGHKNVEV